MNRLVVNESAQDEDGAGQQSEGEPLSKQSKSASFNLVGFHHRSYVGRPFFLPLLNLLVINHRDMNLDFPG